MPELIAMIQTTWSNIRVALYENQDGMFQFVEEGLHHDEGQQDRWVRYHESTPHRYEAEVRAEMLEYYCYSTEDEYYVLPESVTFLEAPDFKGPHHPVLILGRPPLFEK